MRAARTLTAALACLALGACREVPYEHLPRPDAGVTRAEPFRPPAGLTRLRLGLVPYVSKESMQASHARLVQYLSAGLGVPIKRLLTDNGGAFRSKLFAATCRELGIVHKFTRAYRPQTNGKAERFIQSALREWAYGWTYQNSLQRTRALVSWQHHYNWHRPHAGIGGAFPMSRLTKSRNNLLTVHS